MKILAALRSGFSRSLNVWKSALIVFIVMLLFAWVSAVPLKASMKAGFGSGMITDRLGTGFSLEAFTDLGPVFGAILSSFGSILLFLFLLGILLNAFLSGGVFRSVSTGVFSAAEFWSSCSRNFWSFLVITLLTGLMIIFSALIIVGIPMTVMSGGDSGEKAIYNALVVSVTVFLILFPVFILVADYARAWQCRQEKNRCFAAIGFGFGRTFRTFLSSWPLMVIVLVIQVLYLWVVMRVIPGMMPQTGGGVFILFLLSQVLFFGKVMLKVIRYGSVTSLMDQAQQTETGTTPVIPPVVEQIYQT